jgi:hypothetical protein
MTLRTVWRVLVPCAASAMLASIAISAAFYYANRRLRFDEAVLSELQSPDSNPRGYWIAAAGTVAAALCLWPAARLLRPALSSAGPRWAAAAAGLYRLGCAAAIAMAVLEPVAQTFDPLHIALAHLAFLGIVVGLAIFTALAALAWTRAWAWLTVVHALAVLMTLDVVPTPKLGGFWSSLAAAELALCVLVASTTAALARAAATRT